MAEHLYNFAKLQLVGDIDSDDSSIVVNYLPAWLTAANFRVQVDIELMKVTAISGTSLTVARGQEGTTAVGHNGTDTPAFVDVVMTAEGLAQYISENGGGGGGGGETPHFVKVHTSAVQSSANGADHAVSYDTEDEDADGYHSGGAPTRLTVPTGLGGMYYALANVGWAANATGVRSGAFQKNGSGYIGWCVVPTAGAGATTQIPISSMLRLADGDYLEVIAYQDSGGSLNVAADIYFALSRFAD